MHTIFALILAPILAQVSPVPSLSPSPEASPAPTATHTLSLQIPPGWHRTESGKYNQWTGPDGSNFRLTVMPPSADFQGGNALQAVTAMATKLAPTGKADVTKVMICNGTQPAYRIAHMVTTADGPFMMIIPGSVSTGLINYELLGPTPDPAIMKMVDGICWP